MTANDFNTKYAMYLEPSHYGMGINTPIACEIMDRYFQKWKDYPGFSYSQIKMKFNHPRIYVEGVPSEEIEKATQELTNVF